MRKGGGKAKGSSFERQICKELSLWISGGEFADIFWRSAMSGGRSTVAMKKGTKLSAQAGDVSSIHSLGNEFIDRFMIEAKFYKTLNYESLIKGKGNLLAFWQRATHDAKLHGKKPLLIAKQNHFPIVVCLSKAGIRHFRITKIKLKVYEADMYVILWDDFLKLNPKRMRS